VRTGRLTRRDWLRSAGTVAALVAARPRAPAAKDATSPARRPFPASRVGGAVTHFTPASFSPAAFAEAVAQGGVIEFAPGRYEFGAYAPSRPRRPVRLVGAGKGRTILATDRDFGGDYRYENDERRALLLARDRVELEGLTCVGWKYVVGLSGGDHFAGDDSAALFGPGARGGTPTHFTAGVTLKDVAFDRCRRAVFGHGRLQVANVAAWGCDVVDGWAGFWLAVDRLEGCHLYDCRFENIFSPGNRPSNGKPWRAGAGLAICLNINRSNSIGTRDVVIESCTADVMTNYGRWRAGDDHDPGRARRHGDNACPETGFLRATGADGLVLRNSIIRRVGVNAEGVPATLPVQLQAVYLKARGTLIDNVLFERCFGWEGIVTTKGKAADATSGSITLSADTTITNCVFKDGIASLRLDRGPFGSVVTAMPGCLFGKTNTGHCRLDNNIVDNVSCRTAVFGAVYNARFAPERLTARATTIRDCADVGAGIFACGDRTRVVEVTNTRIVDSASARAPEVAAVWNQGETPPRLIVDGLAFIGTVGISHRGAAKFRLTDAPAHGADQRFLPARGCRPRPPP